MKMKKGLKRNKFENKKKNRFLVFMLAEIAMAFLAYFFSKNKQNLV